MPQWTPEQAKQASALLAKGDLSPEMRSKLQAKLDAYARDNMAGMTTQQQASQPTGLAAIEAAQPEMREQYDAASPTPEAKTGTGPTLPGSVGVNENKPSQYGNLQAASQSVRISPDATLSMTPPAATGAGAIEAASPGLAEFRGADEKSQEEEQRLRQIAREAIRVKVREREGGALGTRMTPYDYEQAQRQIDETPTPVLRQLYGPSERGNKMALDAMREGDDKLASASQIQGIYSPPEFVERPGSYQFLGQDVNRQPRPPIYWSEPGLQAFRDYFRPELGDGVDGLDERSALYKVYADMEWKKARDKAEAANIGVVRKAYASSANWKDEVRSRLLAATDAAGGAASLGLDRLLSSGFAEGRRQLGQRDVQEELLPQETALGGIAGSLAPAPTSLFSGVGKSVGKALPSLEREGLRRVLGSGLKGAAGSMALGGTEMGTRALASAIATGDESKLIPDANTAKSLLLQGVVGMGGGMLGQLAGQAGEAGRAALRKPGHTPESDAGAFGLRALDEAGGRVSLLRGIQGGPGMKSAELAAESPSNVARKSAIDIAGERFERPALKEFRKGWEKAKADMRAGVDQAVKAEGKGTAVPWEAIDNDIKKLQDLHFEQSGELLPSAAGKSKAVGRALDRLLAERPRVMSMDNAQQLAAMAPGEVRIYKPRDLRRAGLRFTVAGQEFGPDDVVVLRGKRFTAADAENERALLKEDMGLPRTTEGSHLKAADAERTYGSFRDFIRTNFPKLNHAIKRNQGPIELWRSRANALSLPPDLRGDIALSPAEQKAFSSHVRSPQLVDPQDREVIQGFVNATKLDPAWKTLEGQVAKAALSLSGKVGASMSTSGPRLFRAGTLRSLASRGDNILRALSQMHPDQVATIRSMANRILEGSPREYQAALERFSKAADVLEQRAQALPDNIREGMRTEMGAFVKRARNAGKPGSVTDTEVLSETAPEPLAARGQAANQEGAPSPGGTKELAAYRDAYKEYAKRLQEVARFNEQNDKAMTILRNLDRAPVGQRSITGGRLGRGAANLRVKEKPKLSRGELSLINFILEARGMGPTSKEADAFKAEEQP